MAENHAGIGTRPVCTGDAEFLCSIMNCPSVLQALNEVPTGLQDWTDAIREWSRDDDEEDYIILKTKRRSAGLA